MPFVKSKWANLVFFVDIYIDINVTTNLLYIRDMEKQVFNKKLAKQITKYREEKKLTQGQLAKLCGNKQKQAIQRLETGAITPSAHFVYEIARALKVNVGELMNV